MISSKNIRAGLLTFVIIHLGACTQIHTTTPAGIPQDMTQQEFADYVERVFRHHNMVYNELLTEMALENPDYSDTENAELHAAEQSMLSACEPLNTVVIARTEGHQPEFSAYMKLTSSVPACEIATERVEDLLP